MSLGDQLTFSYGKIIFPPYKDLNSLDSLEYSTNTLP